MDPEIIQGGMGVGVSDWRLARAVSRKGQLGVVSGTALDTVMVRRLQDGDEGGHVRRALKAFPVTNVATAVRDRYFLEGGRPSGTPYALLPMDRARPSKWKQQVTVVANFVEVFLAKEGHEGQVGINYLTKIQLPTLPAIYGAMLAGVDYVLMGAGIPRDIPGVLDQFAEQRPAYLRLDVVGSRDTDADVTEFDPAEAGVGVPGRLRRPKFLAIVSSNSLVTMLSRKANGRVDGFIIEGHTAGGHNAPPRGKLQLDERGEPLYGARDAVDLSKVAQEGIPFWIAGGAGRAGALASARAAGAAGIQVGTLFAFCDESGFESEIKRHILSRSLKEAVPVRTDPLASPTGFPFKAVDTPGSVSEDQVYLERPRICDLGYLRTMVRTESGGVAFRCPAEPVDTYVRSGGDEADTTGRKCLCNSLLANIGLGQEREGWGTEPRFVTSGDDLSHIDEFLQGRTRYSAADVVDYLKS